VVGCPFLNPADCPFNKGGRIRHNADGLSVAPENHPDAVNRHQNYHVLARGGLSIEDEPPRSQGVPLRTPVPRKEASLKAVPVAPATYQKQEPFLPKVSSARSHTVLQRPEASNPAGARQHPQPQDSSSTGKETETVRSRILQGVVEELRAQLRSVQKDFEDQKLLTSEAEARGKRLEDSVARLERRLQTATDVAEDRGLECEALKAQIARERESFAAAERHRSAPQTQRAADSELMAQRTEESASLVPEVSQSILPQVQSDHSPLPQLLPSSRPSPPPSNSRSLSGSEAEPINDDPEAISLTLGYLLTVKSAFQQADFDHLGYLDVATLGQYCQQRGFRDVTYGQLMQMIDAADPTGTGHVDFFGFLGIQAYTALDLKSRGMVFSDWMAFCALGTLPPVAANTRDVTPDNRLALRLSQPHSTAAAALRTEPFEPD